MAFTQYSMNELRAIVSRAAPPDCSDEALRARWVDLLDVLLEQYRNQFPFTALELRNLAESLWVHYKSMSGTAPQRRLVLVRPPPRSLCTRDTTARRARPTTRYRLRAARPI